MIKRKVLLCALLAVSMLFAGCSVEKTSQPQEESQSESIAQSSVSESAAQSSVSESAASSEESLNSVSEVFVDDQTAYDYWNEYETLYAKATLCGQTWTDPTQIDVELLIRFYLYNEAQTAYPAPTGDDLNIHVPAEDLETYVMSYFNVSADYLETSTTFNRENSCYDLLYPDGLGMGPVQYVKVERTGNRLSIYSGSFDDDNEVASLYYKLTVELKEDGGYYYVEGEEYDPPIPAE